MATTGEDGTSWAVAPAVPGWRHVGWLLPSGNLVGRPELPAHPSCEPVYTQVHNGGDGT